MATHALQGIPSQGIKANNNIGDIGGINLRIVIFNWKHKSLIPNNDSEFEAQNLK